MNYAAATVVRGQKRIQKTGIATPGGRKGRDGKKRIKKQDNNI